MLYPFIWLLGKYIEVVETLRDKDSIDPLAHLFLHSLSLCASKLGRFRARCGSKSYLHLKTDWHLHGRAVLFSGTLIKSDTQDSVNRHHGRYCA